MAELEFTVGGVRVEPGAAAPVLVFNLRIASNSGQPVHAVALRTRIVIDARRRRYQPDEESRLLELFGQPQQWPDTLRAVPWADVSTTVPGFEGEATVGLWVACSYDMEVASTKYFHGMEDGDIPLEFQFSGTVFGPGPAGISVTPLPRDLDVAWRMPASVWHDLMASYFAGSRWVRLGPDQFDALCRYKAERVMPTWDAAVDDLLDRAGAGTHPVVLP